MTELHDSDMVYVCEYCLTAACWLGVQFCHNIRTAGTKQMSVGELKALNLEHPCYWGIELIRKKKP